MLPSNILLVAGNMLLVRAIYCRATCCCGVNAALELRVCTSARQIRGKKVKLYLKSFLTSISCENLDSYRARFGCQKRCEKAYE